jgi:uncharacterized protein (DUF1697 family)
VPRYVAFLRGISPTNAKMSDLRRCFEAAGFDAVDTVLSSGNIVFSATAASLPRIERMAEAAMQALLGRSFYTIVRPASALRTLLTSDPYGALHTSAQAKRVVTFLRKPPAAMPALPIELDGARILAIEGCEVFTVYVPSPRGPVFMKLIERTFGADVTTRTWDTVRKCIAAADRAA